MRTPQCQAKILIRGNENWQSFFPNFIFRTLEDVEAAGHRKQAATGTWESRRYLTRVDGLGFSLHHTIVRPGTTTHIQYKNHVEAVLVLAGSGEIEVCQDGAKEGEGEAVLKLEAGSMYALGGQENHYVRATEELSLVCVFNPPVDGGEDHDQNGVFPAIGEDGVALYSFGADKVGALFQPPRSLKLGSDRAPDTDTRTATTVTTDEQAQHTDGAVRAVDGWRRNMPYFIFRTLEDVEAAGHRKQAATGTWESRRYLTRVDGLGFSLHHTIVRPGTTTHIQYKNHVEAVLVLAGSGEIEVCQDGAKEGEGEAVLKLEAGSMYALGGQENHYVRATEELSLVCVFNPPVDGGEDHDQNGVFPAIGEDGVALYSFGADKVGALFQPPRSLRLGSASR